MLSIKLVSPLPFSFLDAYSLSTLSLGCKVLYIIMNFLVLRSIYFVCLSLEVFIKLFSFPFFFSVYFRSVDAYVVCIVSGGCTLFFSAFIYVIFESLYRFINTIPNVDESSFYFFFWLIQSVYVFSWMQSLVHRHEFSCSLVHLLKFFSCPHFEWFWVFYEGDNCCGPGKGH